MLLKTSVIITLAMLAFAGVASAAYQIYIEAEDAAKLEKPIEIKTDKPTAFGGKYIVAPQGVGNDGNGYANFPFDVPKDGKYFFWGRVIAPSGGDDSYFWGIDHPAPKSGENCGGKFPGDQANIWDTGNPFTDWTWSKLNSRNCPEPAKIGAAELKKGKHTLNIIQREDGTELDGIFISDDAAAKPPATYKDARAISVSVEPKGKLAVSWGAIKAKL